MFLGCAFGIWQFAFLRAQDQLTIVLQPDLEPVKADPGQLDQVLVNLAVNARDAMPRGGRLTLETRKVALEESDRSWDADLTPGNYASLAVRDTGVGMDPQTRARIFEPFFTTKERGKGTGLGLSMVHGIVKQSGGALRVRSELECGATFEIYLPCLPGNSETAPVVGAPKPAPRGTETILVVEDQEDLRLLAQTILRAHGYRVLAASNGVEALTVAKLHNGPIHLVVTDVVMPTMGGPELAENLLAHRPETPILFVSGYLDSDLVRQGVRNQDLILLQKPFTPDELMRKVREMLDRSATSRG
jgi:CheY-like chemotaxis protein